MSKVPIELAESYRKAGLAALPAAKAKKRPSIGGWKTWSKRLPSEMEISAWFANSPDGI